MIVLNAFQKTYHQKTVLDFPGFSFTEGKIYAIIGANGSGKSTFAGIIAGFLSADSNAFPYSSVMPAVGYLPQKPYPFRMSVYKNLMLNGSGDNSDDRERAEKLLTALDLKKLISERANRLSGGETVKMALARLLMKEYSFLILDEPTTAMDIHSTLQAERLIKEYRSTNNATIILITHSLKQAQRMADEVLFFQEGRLLEYGPVQQVLTSPQIAATKEFLEFYGA